MDKKKYTLIKTNIWKNIKNETYTVILSYGRDESGKEQKTSKTFDTLKEAEEALILHNADKLKGKTKKKVKVPTIQELMADYKELYIDTQNEKTTAYGYNVISNHITKFFEETKKNPRLDKITTLTIDQYYKYLLNLRTKSLPDGMNPNTVRKHGNYLHQLFEFAVKRSEQYGIRVNPVMNSTPPKKKKANTPDLSAYTVEKIMELCIALRKSNDLPLECGVLIALMGGARRGETDFLKWTQVDLENGILSFKGCRTCADIEIEKDSTKSGHDRDTSMPDILADALKRYKDWQLANQELLGGEYYECDNVLVRADGKPYASRWISRKFSEFLKKNNFPHIRYHDLRHLNASMLLESLPVAIVSEHLGHTNVNTTTKIYAHNIRKKQPCVANELNAVFGSISA